MIEGLALNIGIMLIGLFVSILAVLLLIIFMQIAKLAKKFFTPEEIKQSSVLSFLGLFDGNWAFLTGVHKDTVMEGHEYDGIVELDNGMPPWLVNLFYATALFAVVYMIYYHGFDNGKIMENEYKAEVAQAALTQKDEGTGVTTYKPLTDQAALASGKALFDKECVACHGKEGQGVIGPNLTDEYWIHGGEVNSIFRTIKVGVPDKGMVAWKSRFSGKQMLELASYILSLQGTNPPNAKEAQGEKGKQ